MRTEGSLAHRLTRAIALQAGLITLTAVFGVYLTTVMLEEVLIKQALRQEAAHFWDLRAKDPQFHLPNTANLTGYLLNGDTHNLNAQLRELPLGFPLCQDSCRPKQFIERDTNRGW